MRELSQLGIVFYSGHCTGIPAFNLIKQIMGDKLIALYSGETAIEYSTPSRPKNRVRIYRKAHTDYALPYHRKCSRSHRLAHSLHEKKQPERPR